MQGYVLSLSEAKIIVDFLSPAQANATNVRGDGADGEEDQDAFINSLTKQELDELRSMTLMDKIYARLVGSIAPTVYGE